MRRKRVLTVRAMIGIGALLAALLACGLPGQSAEIGLEEETEAPPDSTGGETVAGDRVPTNGSSNRSTH